MLENLVPAPRAAQYSVPARGAARAALARTCAPRRHAMRYATRLRFAFTAPPKFCSAPRTSQGRCFLAPRAPSAPATLPTPLEPGRRAAPPKGRAISAAHAPPSLPADAALRFHVAGRPGNCPQAAHNHRQPSIPSPGSLRFPVGRGGERLGLGRRGHAYGPRAT